MCNIISYSYKNRSMLIIKNCMKSQKCLLIVDSGIEHKFKFSMVFCAKRLSTINRFDLTKYKYPQYKIFCEMDLTENSSLPTISTNNNTYSLNLPPNTDNSFANEHLKLHLIEEEGMNEWYQNPESQNEYSHNAKITKFDHFMDALMLGAEFMGMYPHSPMPTTRGLLGFDDPILPTHDGHCSRASQFSEQDPQKSKFQKFSRSKNFSDQLIQIEEPVSNHIAATSNVSPLADAIKEEDVSAKEREKADKIMRIQQVGCNCRKSKCLKMYCECFHLQIYCSQNCNCLSCGNSGPNESHQKAVIDALARNPKAFEQEKPCTEKGFKLGLALDEVKKGCKCRKTKCMKKYCECFNSGGKCSIFCKCQDCENNNI